MTPTGGTPSALRNRAQEYLAIRRALGYKLLEHERLLMQFLDHLEQAELATVTTDAAVAWATGPAEVKPIYWRRRLGVVRSFARHLSTVDAACEVPPPWLLPCFTNRVPPHLYSGSEILALMQTPGRVFHQPLRAATYRVLIGLLAVTGLRTGEAVRLDRDHLDLDAGILTILDSKYGKSRQVLLHASTVTALRDYASLRDQAVGPTVGAPAFFVSTRGRLLVNTVDYTFADLVKATGIRTPPSGRAPRLHDLRNTFAVTTLLEWYRAGVDVQARLPALSTWLGHISPASTYWYLQAAPELLALTARRLEHHAPQARTL